jgi:hypothetical protein
LVSGRSTCFWTCLQPKIDAFCDSRFANGIF